MISLCLGWRMDIANKLFYECEMESGLPCTLVRDVMHKVF
jgi:hypothetical protein